MVIQMLVFPPCFHRFFPHRSSRKLTLRPCHSAKMSFHSKLAILRVQVFILHTFSRIQTSYGHHLPSAPSPSPWPWNGHRSAPAAPSRSWPGPTPSPRCRRRRRTTRRLGRRSRTPPGCRGSPGEGPLRGPGKWRFMRVDGELMVDLPRFKVISLGIDEDFC